MNVYFHTDENCRKGCHVVSEPCRKGHTGKQTLLHLFSVDEPGAWWDSCWNVHVDGCDYAVNSKDEAIRKGMAILGYTLENIIEAGAFYPA